MNMNKVNPNPSFKSLIRVSNLAYAKSIQQNKLMPCVDYPWRISDSKYLTKGYSEGASYCTMGVIKNEEGEGFLFHLRPGASKLKDIKDYIAKAARQLQRQEPLTGILVGGNKSYKPSKDLYQSLIDIFEELNIKFSALLGQKNIITYNQNVPSCNLYFDGKSDKYAIYSNIFEDKRYKDKPLEEIFDIIQINKRDAVESRPDLP